MIYKVDVREAGGSLNHANQRGGKLSVNGSEPEQSSLR